MIKSPAYGLLFLLLALGACGTKPVPKKKITVRPAVIHPLFFQDEIASQINFPFWFNDSLIRQQQIRQLTRTVYSTFGLDPEQSENTETFPKLKTVYTFSREGKLIFIERTNYSEGIVIAQKNYAFTPSTGIYSEVISAAPVESVSGGQQESYVLVEKKQGKHSLLHYKDRYSGIRYLFYPNRKFQGALSVDSIGHPTAHDWIICGTPGKPEKRYQVRNTVTETKVSHYSYLNDNFPEMISRSDYPFTQKRYFSYTREGIFKGYIDSTFIDDSFITSIVTSFTLDKLDRPVEITHQKDHASGSASYRTIEKIDYTFFTSN